MCLYVADVIVRYSRGIMWQTMCNSAIFAILCYFNLYCAANILDHLQSIDD